MAHKAHMGHMGHMAHEDGGTGTQRPRGPTAEREALHRREYPRLLAQLDRLVELARARDPNVAFVALFGSVARLEAGTDSDADVLLLAHDPDQFHAGTPTPGIHLMWMAYQGDLRVNGDWEELGRWPATAVVSDAQASDLEEDFLANVARDGVELYRQAGYVPPVVLAHLLPLDTWRGRMIGRVGAEDPRRAEAGPSDAADARRGGS
jgi:hypothetical protein